MGKLLGDNEYKELMKTKSFEEFVEYLYENTEYKNVFEKDSNKTLHRNIIEIEMKKNLFRNFEKFYHFYYDNYRTFFKILFMRYEVENLKIFMRALNRNEDISVFEEHVITSEVFSNVDYTEVLKSKNIDEFVENLKGTIYYKLLNVYLNEKPLKMQFYMEMNLDRIYFKKIKEINETFKGKDRELLYELLGRNSDLLNIQWIYRAKKYYNMSAEEILNYTLESGMKFDYKKLKMICYIENVEEIKEIIMKTEYKILFEDEEIMMERNMERYLYNLLEDLFKRGNNTIIVPLTFLHKLEYEMRDIFTILECINYKKDNINNYMIREIV